MKYGKPADGFALHLAGQRATNYKNFATPFGPKHNGNYARNPSASCMQPDRPRAEG